MQIVQKNFTNILYNLNNAYNSFSEALFKINKILQKRAFFKFIIINMIKKRYMMISIHL